MDDSSYTLLLGLLAYKTPTLNPKPHPSGGDQIKAPSLMLKGYLIFCITLILHVFVK